MYVLLTALIGTALAAAPSAEELLDATDDVLRGDTVEAVWPVAGRGKSV